MQTRIGGVVKLRGGNPGGGRKASVTVNRQVHAKWIMLGRTEVDGEMEADGFVAEDVITFQAFRYVDSVLLVVVILLCCPEIDVREVGTCVIGTVMNDTSLCELEEFQIFLFSRFAGSVARCQVMKDWAGMRKVPLKRDRIARIDWGVDLSGDRQMMTDYIRVGIFPTVNESDRIIRIFHMPRGGCWNIGSDGIPFVR